MNIFLGRWTNFNEHFLNPMKKLNSMNPFFYIDEHFLKFDEQKNLREFEKKFHKESEK